MKKLFLFTAMALVIALSSAPQVMAATITVDSCDSVSGTCTLPDAITSANTDTATGGCAAGSGDDTITFAAGLSGKTITLSSTLTLKSNITVDGSSLASNIQISGNNAMRVFDINSGKTAVLKNLSIINGKYSYGGGILNVGTLTVSSSTFSGNSATSSDGGGIFNVDTLTVSGSTFTGNSTSMTGGGIYNQGTLTVSSSTFSGNSASTKGGGIFNMDTLTVSNSTFSGNSAPIGGGIWTNNALALNNSILADDTGGDCINSGTISSAVNNLIEGIGANACGLSNGVNGNIIGVDPMLSALADNGGSTQTMALQSGSPAINAGDTAACTTTDQRGYPRLGACDIGAFESVVFSSIVTNCNDSGPGSLRDVIANATAGDTVYFLLDCTGASPITLNSTLSISKNLTVDGTGHNIRISGNNAVRVFDINSGITAALNNLSIINGKDSTGGGIRNQGTLTVGSSTFAGNSGSTNGGGIWNQGTLTVGSSTFAGNSAPSGGGIWNNSLLTVRNCTFSGNSGGGIWNNNTLTVNNSILADDTGGDCINSGTISSAVNNLIKGIGANACGLSNGVNGNIIGVDPKLSALADNGGSTQTMALQSGSPAINAGDTAACTTTDQRGIARLSACDIGAFEYAGVVTNCNDRGPGSLRDAITNANAGDIVMFDSGLNCTGASPITLNSTLSISKNLTVDGTGHNISISGNNAVRVFGINSGITAALNNLSIINGKDSTGGGIRNQGTLTVGNSTFSGNSATSAGGINNEGTLTVNGSTFSGNSATYGGGISSYGTLTVSGSTFSGNSVTMDGGGIQNEGTLTVSGSTFSGNSATSGGGINNQGTLTVSSSTFSGNSATSAGGGIYNYINGTLTVSSSTFSGNSATSAGGGIYNYVNGTLTVSSSTFSGNSAASAGGIYNLGTHLTLNNTILADDTGGDCINSGTISSAVNNLIEGTGANACGLSNGVNGNIIGVDPKLSALGSNGGGTQTMALQAGSPAINTGNTTLCGATDQRGYPHAGSCDIGAFEYGWYYPSVSFITASQSQSESTPTMKITAQLSGASPVDVTVPFTVAGTAAGGTDYTITPSPIIIPSGSYSADITITVNNDSTDEPDETVIVAMGTPTAAAGTITVHTATIIDDDTARFSINDVTVTEGNSGTVNADFTVSLSCVSASTVTVDYATADNTATTADSDYTAISGTLVFSPGETSKTVRVSVNGDTSGENNETFYVNLSNPANATISDNQGIGTIVNDDNLKPTTSGIANMTVNEDSANTVINLLTSFNDVESGAGGLVYSVQSNSNSGLVTTAVSGSNLTLAYTANSSGTATITVRAADSAGLYAETTFTVTVNAVNDNPTTTGISNVTVTENSANTVINLSTYFSDIESGAAGLIYTVLSNTNPGLVTAGILGSSLTLSYAPNANGVSSITVRGTDSGWLYADSTFTVTVTAVNKDSVYGDVNGDDKVDLQDAVLALRIPAGISVTDTVNLDADVNGDKKIGMEEVIYILQKVSGLRP